MEKIQKAIAKARTSRDETPGAPTPDGATITAAAPARETPGADTARDAWARLQAFEPSRERLSTARIMTLDNTRDATPFDVMRTKTLQTLRANQWRRLAITSPTPECGKSTIASNLAFSLARQSDVRTIVFELDMRRSSLSRLLGLTPPYGVADVLNGRIPFADQALCYNRNLAFSLSKGQVTNTAELLQSAEVALQIDAIEAEYAPDLMIFDMPPMLVNDDMMAFAGRVDSVLLTAAAEATTIKEIDTCERELASQTNVMGVALNKCRYMPKEANYAGYY